MLLETPHTSYRCKKALVIFQFRGSRKNYSKIVLGSKMFLREKTLQFQGEKPMQKTIINLKAHFSTIFEKLHTTI